MMVQPTDEKICRNLDGRSLSSLVETPELGLARPRFSSKKARADYITAWRMNGARPFFHENLAVRQANSGVPP